MWGSIAVLVAGTVLSLVVFARNTGRNFDTPIRNEPAQVYREPKTVRLTSASSRDALRTTKAFLEAGVLREDPELAWELSHPSLRGSDSKAAWRSGFIPVTPYPLDVRKTRYSVAYSYPNLLGMTVTLFPKTGEKLRPIAFGVELKRQRAGAREHWLVSSFSPRPLPLEAQIAGVGLERRGPAPSATYSHALSATWLLLPGFILLGIVIVPATLMLRSWWRGSRAMRRYEASLTSSDPR